MIKICKLKKEYDLQQKKVVGLYDVNLDLPSDGLICILGKSGSGKTTLLNILAGLDEQNAGEICIYNERITEYTEEEWDSFRKKRIGVIFQDFNLFENETVYNNLALTLKIIGNSKEEIDKKVDDILCFLKLEKCKERRVSQLSAGQKQRIAIGRALVKNPDIILADEPTGNLDRNNSKVVFELLSEIAKESLVLLITHDEESAFCYASRIIKIQDGRITEDINRYGQKSCCIKKIKVLSKGQRDVKSFQNADTMEKDVIQYVVEQIHKYQKETDNIELSLQVEVEKNNECFEKKRVQKNELIQDFVDGKKTPFLLKMELIRIALANLMKRKVRLTFTFIMLCIAVFMSLTTVSLRMNKVGKSVESYVRDNQIRYVSFQKECAYFNEIEDECKTFLRSGKKFKSELLRYYDAERIYNCLDYLNIADVTEEKSYETTAVLYDGNERLYRPFLKGNYPDGDEQVIVSEKIAEELCLKKPYIGNYILVDGAEYQIVGLLQNLRGQNDLDNIDDKIILPYDYIKRQKTLNYVSVRGENIIRSSALTEYLTDYTRYGSVQSIKNEKLLCGRMPEKDNEVLINEYLAEDIGYLDKQKNYIEHDLELLNLHSEKYNDAYEDYLNMYEFFPDGVKIVGVFRDAENVNADYLLQENVYKKLAKVYYDDYSYNQYVVDISGESHIIDLYNLGYELDDERAVYISSFNDFLKEIRPILDVLTFVSWVLSFFLVVSYIGCHINDNSKNVGILRTLGISRKNTAKIFLYESIFISFLSILIANILASAGLRQANKYLYVTAENMQISFISINRGIWFVVDIVLLILVVSCTYIPIYNMSKKKPIVLLDG